MSEPPPKGTVIKPGKELPVLKFTGLDDPHASTPMNFRVSAQFHREFKVYAVQHDMSMVELLQKSFQLMKYGKR